MKVNFISAFLYRVVQKIQKKSTSNDIFRLGYQKINLVVLQRGRFDECNNENAIDLMKKYLIKLPVNLCRNGVRINWNRLSVLDETGTLSKVLKENSIDCNNYNWPVPLHLLAGVDKEGRYKGKMDNSELASKAILNIPCW